MNTPFVNARKKREVSILLRKKERRLDKINLRESAKRGIGKSIFLRVTGNGCHADQPEHSHMRALPDYRHYLEVLQNE